MTVKMLPNFIRSSNLDNVRIESSKDFDQVMKIIGILIFYIYIARNRKYLLDLFKNIE